MSSLGAVVELERGAFSVFGHGNSILCKMSTSIFYNYMESEFESRGGFEF